MSEPLIPVTIWARDGKYTLLGPSSEGTEYIHLGIHKDALAEKGARLNDFKLVIDQQMTEIEGLHAKLAQAVEALNEIASWCPTPENPDACKIAECKIARDALAALNSPAKSENSK